MINRPEQEDKVKGLIQVENYSGSSLELDDWNLDEVLDDILMVQFIDVSEDGTQLKRGSIYVPVNVVNFAWRIGKVILAGPNVSQATVGKCVVFPNDKGLKVDNLNGLKNIVFLNESRIFGICSPKEDVAV